MPKATTLKTNHAGVSLFIRTHKTALTSVRKAQGFLSNGQFVEAHARLDEAAHITARLIEMMAPADDQSERIDPQAYCAIEPDELEDAYEGDTANA